MNKQLKSGVYEGKAKGMDGEVTAKVTINDNKITNVDLDLSGESCLLYTSDAADEL